MTAAQDNPNFIPIALLQMNSVLQDKNANLEKAEALLASLDEPVRLACLPELFNTGYDLEALGESLFEQAEPVPAGETTRRLAELARRFRTALAAGVVEQVPDVTGLIYDTVLLINRDGELAARYRKSHLYPAEHRYFRPGGELPVFELDGLRVGVATCFEAAFPAIFSTLAVQGAQLVINPSAVPTGFDHLQDLRTRARAQDNQYYVAAVNHVGLEGGVVYCGRSQVADPRGEVIALAPDREEAAVIARLDLGLIRDQRLQEPTLRGFRPELYRFTPP